jgi:hypothetical protein
VTPHAGPCVHGYGLVARVARIGSISPITCSPSPGLVVPDLPPVRSPGRARKSLYLDDDLSSGRPAVASLVLLA